MTLRTLSLVVCALVGSAASLFAQSDPMAKWKPHQGDRFTYGYFHREWDPQWDVNFGEFDTTISLTISVVHIDSNSIAVDGGYSLSWFPSFDTSRYRFIFGTPWYGSMGRFLIPKDGAESMPFQGDTISLYSATLGTYPPNPNSSYSSEGSIVMYSPEIHWYYSLIREVITNESERYHWTHTYYIHDEYTLSSAITQTSSVEKKLEFPCSQSIATAIGLINFTLITPSNSSVSFLLNDCMARPIRTWQMPTEAGERQITLNVADVPSGVYFLRVSGGGGVEEVRKVCIAH